MDPAQVGSDLTDAPSQVTCHNIYQVWFILIIQSDPGIRYHFNLTNHTNLHEKLWNLSLGNIVAVAVDVVLCDLLTFSNIYLVQKLHKIEINL